MPAPTRRRRILLLLPLIVVLGLIAWRSHKSNGVTRHIESLRARGEPASIADYAASLTHPPPDQNGAPLLLDAARRLDRPTLDRFLSKPLAAWNPAEVESAIAHSKEAAQAEALQLLKEASRKSAFQFTTAADLLKRGALQDHGREIHDAIRFLVFQAQVSSSQDLPQEACSHILDALALTAALELDGSLITEVFRQSSVDLALDCLSETLGRHAPPPETLLKLEAGSLRVGSVAGYRRSLRWSRAATLEYRTSFVPPAGSSPYAALHETLYGLSGGRASDLVLYLDYATRLHEVLEWQGTTRWLGFRELRYRFAADSKGWNRAHSRLVVPPLLHLAEQVHRIHARAECARVACVIERFRLLHQGALPDSLGELVPEFLPDVPLDPFDGQPLRYRRLDRGYTVYSVGINETDESGAAPSPRDPTRTGDVPFTVAR